jgi:hypothetical protein
MLSENTNNTDCILKCAQIRHTLSDASNNHLPKETSVQAGQH